MPTGGELHIASLLLLEHGFEHGFSLRTGGVSSPPYDSLNLGEHVGDVPDRVVINRERFLGTVYASLSSHLFEADQVHGASVRVVQPREARNDVRSEEADALVSSHANHCVGVRTADCVPLLIGDKRTGAVAAVHAGWRGLVAGVIAETVRVLHQTTRSSPEEFLVAIGPHIRADSFEVGDDVSAQLCEAAFGEPVSSRRNQKWYVDLHRVAHVQLLRAGVQAPHIDDLDGCTYSEPERFFSFRRDGKKSGRHLSVISVRDVRVAG